MIKIKKSELEAVLLSISMFDPKENKMVGGLLSENISLGTKRKLQKIHKAAVEEYKQLISDMVEIEKEFGEDTDKIKEEKIELLKEEVEINAEPFLISSIEDIKTVNNYSFEVLEKIGV